VQYRIKMSIFIDINLQSTNTRTKPERNVPFDIALIFSSNVRLNKMHVSRDHRAMHIDTEPVRYQQHICTAR
jgi:hypothetical protein